MASLLVISGAFFIPVVIIIAKLTRHERLYKDSLSPAFWEHHWNDSLESMALFLLPLGIALAASLITQIEFRNNAWKQLHATPQNLTTIFFAKLAVILVMMLQFFLLFNIGVYLSGAIPGLLFGAYPQESVPYVIFLKESFKYFIDCLPIVALQYTISLQARNFLVPVGAGIALWILSIALLGWEHGHLFPYSYCGFNYLRGIGKYQGDAPLHLLALIYFIFFTVAGYILYIGKKEKG